MQRLPIESVMVWEVNAKRFNTTIPFGGRMSG
jgi:hypothetical protein